MRKILHLLVLFLLVSTGALAQGWPAKYTGVMLQGFYWDSYTDSKLTNLTSQADELSKYFDLIWLPNTGMTSDYKYNKRNTMGYDPCFWLNQNSCWGTEAELRTLINTYKTKGTGIIEDVVINHKNGDGSWVNFPNESVTGTTTGKTYTLTWDNTNYTGICNNDEANSNSASGVAGKIQGAADTGDNFDGYRDLDHTNAQVQANVKTYLDYLLNEIGYAGFRYDMVKGYGSQYTKIYNEASQPTYSVGEYWDGQYNNVVGWINGTGKTSAAFDFPLKYAINSAFGSGNWSALSNKGIAGDAGESGMSRYAVTFVDNHDTYRNNDKLSNNVLAANAFILALPGTPCIFLPHWKAYKTELGKMIEARKKAGINNQSTITRQEAVDNGGAYVTVVKGTSGSIMVISGYATSVNTDGWTAVSVGTNENPNYAFYISDDNGGGTGTGDDDKTEKTANVYVQADEAPNVYVWDANKSPISAAWPGTKATESTIINGVKYWKTTFTYTASTYNVIFNMGGDDTKTKNITGLTGDVYYKYDSSRKTATVVDPNNGGGTEEPTTKTTLAGVYVQASTAPYLYAWDTSNTKLNGKWPGTQMTETRTVNGETYWYKEFPYTTSTYNIIFNMGSSSSQTGNLEGLSGDVFYTYNGSRTATQQSSLGEIAGRTFTADQPATVCLPYDLSADEVSAIDGTFYTFTAESNGILTFDPVTTVTAYQPYVFVSKTNGQTLSSLSSKTKVQGKPIGVTKGNFTFVGSTTKQSKISTSSESYYTYRASDGTFIKGVKPKGFTVKPYRCYFSTTTASAAKHMVFTGATAINRMTTTTNTPAAIYNLNGQRVRQDRGALPKGIYIIAGHKVIVK